MRPKVRIYDRGAGYKLLGYPHRYVVESKTSLFQIHWTQLFYETSRDAAERIIKREGWEEFVTS